MNAVFTATTAALLIAAASVARAQAEAPTTNGANPGEHQHQAMQNASHADLEQAKTAGATPATFVAAAAQTGMAEVQLAKVALQKSSNEEVQQFAHKMVQDHTQANQQLIEIAKSKGLHVPTRLDAKHEAMVKDLSAKSGDAFDAAYAEHMAKGHAQAVAMFEAAAKSSDPDLAAFAQKTLPTLEVHKQLADSLHASTSTRTASAGSAR
jgi:putative membrane protein